MNTDVLTFDWTPTSNTGRITLTAKLGDEVLGVDTLNVLNADARAKYAKRLTVDHAGIDQQQVDDELLAIAAEMAQPSGADNPPAHAPTELDVSRVVRPERFLLPEVSGLTVATPTLVRGKPGAQWTLYLNWTDGKREAIDLPPSLALPDQTTLWLHPMPGTPTISEEPAWTFSAREAWLGTSSTKHGPDVAEVFQRLCRCVAHYVYFPTERAAGTTATLALWVMLTYSYPAWSAAPYLYLGGQLESGKTRVFEVLSRLVFRPLLSSNMTAPSLFRTLHERGGTLLYDEAERLKDNKPDVGEVRSMLLAGYKRGGKATRLEPVGDTYRPVEFSVYGPKAMACIKGLPEALASRCIQIIMFRAPSGAPQPRRRIDKHAERWRALRADLHALALNHGPTLLELAEREDVCPQMSGRQYELWQPILSLAAWVEAAGAEGLLDAMQAFALESVEASKTDQMPDCDEILLRALTEMRKAGEWPTAKEVLAKAAEEDAKTFESWSPKGASNALKRYGLLTTKSQGRRHYGRVSPDALRQVQTTYGFELGLRDEAADSPSNVPHVPHVPPKVAQEAPTDEG